MVRNLMIVFLSVLVIGGVVWADQPQTSAANGDNLAKTVHSDENWAVRSGELHKFDASRHAWTSDKAGSKALQIDTLLYFPAEIAGLKSWTDKIQLTEWDTVDNTADLVAGYWHRDTFNAISGDYSLWWGDSTIGPNGGYLSERIEYIDVPAVAIDAGDAPFLIYKQYVRCEEQHGSLIFEGWDGYNVRIDTTDDDANFFEIEPYQVAAGASRYQAPPDDNNEWNILRCWERWGQQFGPYVPPYGQWIGGFANDGTGDGGGETTITKIYDLRPFAGQTVNLTFAGASDWGFDTLDDSTLFGYIIDDVLIVDGLDSQTLAVLDTSTGAWPAFGGDTLFFEDFETADPGWTTRVPGVPTGNWWFLIGIGHESSWSAQCSDPGSGAYPENCDNALRSPKLASSQFDANMAELDLMWYLKCYTANDHSSAYNQYRVYDGGEWDQWRQVSVLTHPTGHSYVYSLDGVTTADWWDVDQWSDFMHNMTPLVTDTTMTWDSLQVQVGFSSDAGWDTTGYYGLMVDDVTLSGRIGAPYDIGVSAMKIPGPNANDWEVIIDSVAITNYGFNTAASGVYQVYMTVLDTAHNAVFGPTQVLDFLNAPNVEPLETVMAPLDPTQAKFTMTKEDPYDIKVSTFWASDTSTYNDTLKTEYGTKAFYYPGFFNYPAGQGQLRYHDSGLYNHPYLNIRTMGDGDIAAVHFTPDTDLYPFDLRLGLPEMKGIGETYNFKVWGSGNTPDEAPLLATIPFTTSTGDTLKFWRIELDTIAALQHMSSDFWMGVEFPDTTADYVMGTESAENDQLGRNWGHSYLDTDTTTWEPYDYDWVITAVISWRTIDPEALPSLSGPPSKNSSGNLHLDWADVSEAQDYLIYRSTHIESTFPLLDSTAVSNYTDVGVVGNLTTHYYYLFNTRHVDGGVFDKTSKAIGEFDRSLLNAK